jgi:hypothetical protein
MDSFDQDAAEVYDTEPRGDELSTVALLAELARGGPALELVIARKNRTCVRNVGEH